MNTSFFDPKTVLNSKRVIYIWRVSINYGHAVALSANRKPFLRLLPSVIKRFWRGFFKMSWWWVMTRRFIYWPAHLTPVRKQTGSTLYNHNNCWAFLEMPTCRENFLGGNGKTRRIERKREKKSWPWESPHPLDLPNKDGRRRDKELETISTPKQKEEEEGKKKHPGKPHEISRKKKNKKKIRRTKTITKERSQPNDNTLSWHMQAGKKKLDMNTVSSQTPKKISVNQN